MLQLALKGMKYAAHSPARMLLALRLAFWLGAISVVFRFWSLPHALSLFSVTPKKSVLLQQDKIKRVRTTADGLLGLNALFFKPVCWKRAVLLQRYLAQYGLLTQIVFGVRKEASGGLVGHAWLEVEGKPIFENEVPDYTTTYTFPAHDVSKR